jgi:hypothetical protein
MRAIGGPQRMLGADPAIAGHPREPSGSERGRGLRRCPQSMSNPRKQTSLWRPLAVHVAMGAGLGAFFALTLIVEDASAGTGHSAMPEWTAAALAGFFILLFAVGAGITGYIFDTMDRS